MITIFAAHSCGGRGSVCCCCCCLHVTKSSFFFFATSRQVKKLIPCAMHCWMVDTHTCTNNWPPLLLDTFNTSHEHEYSHILLLYATYTMREPTVKTRQRPKANHILFSARHDSTGSQFLHPGFRNAFISLLNSLCCNCNRVRGTASRAGRTYLRYPLRGAAHKP